jgi:hypothetical protein
MSESEMVGHILAAREELRRAMASRDCGACRELLGAEVTHLEGLADLTGKVEAYVDSQEETSTMLATANGRADRAMGRPEGPAGPAPHRPGGFRVMDLVQNRVRITDVIGFGGR